MSWRLLLRIFELVKRLWCFLSVFYLSTLHSLNLWTGLPSSYSLGDKRGLSLGVLIRPKCITILYHNLSLYIDIFHVTVMFLCCFGLFYTVCNFPMPKQQTQDSAGKSGYWVAEEEHLQITWKLTGGIFQTNNEDTQKGSQRGATGCPGGLGAPPLAAPGGAPGAPGPPLVAPFCIYVLRPPKTLGTGLFTEFRRRFEAEPYGEEKGISGGQIPRGRSPPGRGDRRHRHHHRHGHHRDHHQHHPQHQHHLHLHPNLIFPSQLVL